MKVRQLLVIWAMLGLSHGILTAALGVAGGHGLNHAVGTTNDRKLDKGPGNFGDSSTVFGGSDAGADAAAASEFRDWRPSAVKAALAPCNGSTKDAIRFLQTEEAKLKNGYLSALRTLVSQLNCSDNVHSIRIWMCLMQVGRGMSRPLARKVLINYWSQSASEGMLDTEANILNMLTREGFSDSLFTESAASASLEENEMFRNINRATESSSVSDTDEDTTDALLAPTLRFIPGFDDDADVANRGLTTVRFDHGDLTIDGMRDTSPAGPISAHVDDNTLDTVPATDPATPLATDSDQENGDGSDSTVPTAFEDVDSSYLQGNDPENITDNYEPYEEGEDEDDGKSGIVREASSNDWEEQSQGRHYGENNNSQSVASSTQNELSLSDEGVDGSSGDNQRAVAGAAEETIIRDANDDDAEMDEIRDNFEHRATEAEIDINDYDADEINNNGQRDSSQSIAPVYDSTEHGDAVEAGDGGPEDHSVSMATTEPSAIPSPAPLGPLRLPELSRKDGSAAEESSDSEPHVGAQERARTTKQMPTHGADKFVLTADSKDLQRLLIDDSSTPAILQLHAECQSRGNDEAPCLHP
jgi:hypothetical protein